MCSKVDKRCVALPKKFVSDHCLEYTWCYGRYALSNNINKVLDLL